MLSKLLIASLLVSVAVFGQFNPQVRSGVHTVSRTDLYLLKKLKNVASSCAVSYENYCKDEGLTKGMVPCLVSHALDLDQECLESLKEYPLAYCFAEGQKHCQSLLPMTPSQLFYCLWSQVDGLKDSECVAGLRHGNEELEGDDAVVEGTVVVQTETADPDLAFTDFTAAPPATMTESVDEDDDDEDDDDAVETGAPERRHGPPRDGRRHHHDDDEDDGEDRRHHGHGRRGDARPPRRGDDEEDDEDERRPPRKGDDKRRPPRDEDGDRRRPPREGDARPPREGDARPPREGDARPPRDGADKPSRPSEDDSDKSEERGHGRRHRRPHHDDDEDEESSMNAERRFHGRHRGPLHSVFAVATVLFVGLGIVAVVKRIVRRRRAAALEGSYQNVPAASYA